MSKIQLVLQYTLTNPNRGVPIRKDSAPITELLRISEVTLILWRINNTRISINPIYKFDRLISFSIL